MNISFFTKVLPLLVATSFTSQVVYAQQGKTSAFGYQVVGVESPPQEYEAGFSMYTSIWSLLDRHPGKSYQTGLFGTWMGPKSKNGLSKKIGSEANGGLGYIKIEGGLGLWRGTHFPTLTPKFVMGGVADSLKSWANGPGSGKHTPLGKGWDPPQGAYGVAQLSPWVVFPLDGLAFKPGAWGQVFGYGYLPLPLSEKKAKTKERNFTIGDQSWTLFLNTKFFKGPLAFFTPHYWAKNTAKHPHLDGLSFDSQPSNPQRSIAMETQHISGIEAEDSEGNVFARIIPMSFPINENGDSILMQDNTNYKKAALWDEVDKWFKGGEIATGKIATEHAATTKMKKGLASNWRMRSKGVRYYMDWHRFASRAYLGDEQYCYKWKEKFVHLDYANKVARLPEYFQLVKISDKQSKWQPVHVKDVPESTKLTSLKAEDFYTGDNNSRPLVTPFLTEEYWSKSGPASGPHHVDLSDGSQLTYYWYRFCDQPAIRVTHYTESELQEMQRRVELLHTNWRKDKAYLPSPRDPKAQLVELDPALLVTPPKGMEIGYVPIAIEQKIK